MCFGPVSSFQSVGKTLPQAELKGPPTLPGSTQPTLTGHISNQGRGHCVNDFRDEGFHGFASKW